MGAEQLDYSMILADLENKKAALDATIASFRAALASGALGQVGELPPSQTGLTSNGFASTFVPSISGGEVPAGAFLGKSIPEASKLYLQIIKKKQTSREISDALKRGGIESTSKNFQQIVHAILDRARKGNIGIVKLDRSYWGLAEWYPAGLRNTVMPDKRSGKRKARKKGAKAAAVTEEAKTKLTGPDKEKEAVGKQTAFERITQLLRRNSGNVYTPAEVAHELGMLSNVTSMLMGRLATTGKLEVIEGKYRAARPQLVAAAG